MSEEGTEIANCCETCREPGLLLWLAAGTLEKGERARLEESVRHCPLCRDRFEEGNALRRVIHSSSSSPPPRLPEELVAIARDPFDEIGLWSLSRIDREVVEVLRRVDADLDASSSLSKWRPWIEEALGAILPTPGAGLTGWLRSPAVAYLLLLTLVYPAYRGLSADPGDGELAPAVLSAPLGLDGPARSGLTPAVTVREGTLPSVITVFVPVDERYHYRIEIVDSTGRSRFVEEDARSFGAHGTFALLLPRGSFSAGAYELRVEELDGENRLVEVFRFPFQVQP